jgi:hypothetical protein
MMIRYTPKNSIEQDVLNDMKVASIDLVHVSGNLIQLKIWGDDNRNPKSVTLHKNFDDAAKFFYNPEDHSSIHPQMIALQSGRYVVFNGIINGRRQKVYGTYRKDLAEEEFASRLEGNIPNIKHS